MTRHRFRISGRTVLTVIAAVAVLGMGAWRSASAQVYPVPVCIEYPTDTGDNTVLTHFAYYNSGAEIVIQRGFPNNYLFPEIFNEQPNTFFPGYVNAMNVSFPLSHSQSFTWFLGNFGATIYPPGNSATDSNLNPLPPTPMCASSFGAATLNLSGSSTYTHQFLGYVTSAPGPSETTAVTGFTNNSNVTLRNLTYVPSDTSYPGGNALPNSIYGDINVAGGATGTIGIVLEVTVNGASVADGMVQVTLQ